MKKIILCFLALTASVFAFAKDKSSGKLNYECPDVDVSNYFVIDLSEYKNASVNAAEVLFNANNSNSIMIYGNDPRSKEWEGLAKMNFRGFSDKKKKNFSNKEAADWRYLYVAAENNADYIYKVSFSGKVLRLEVREKNNGFGEAALPALNEANTYVFKISDYEAEDYVVLRNYTDEDRLVVVPYYYDKAKFKWVKGFEMGILDGYNDSEKVEIIDDEGIEGIKYLALQIEPEGEYDFRLFENHSDLYIDINTKGTRKAKIYIED